jgi:hypothetical protein
MHSSNIGSWCCKSIQMNVKSKILRMWINSKPLVFLWYFYGFYEFFCGLSVILWTCIGTSIETCINYTRKCFVYSKHINCCWSWPLLATLYFQNLVHIQITPCSNIWFVILWWDYCFNTLLGATNVKFHFLL